jgi:hypothetical protein
MFNYNNGLFKFHNISIGFALAQAEFYNFTGKALTEYLAGIIKEDALEITSPTENIRQKNCQ